MLPTSRRWQAGFRSISAFPAAAAAVMLGLASAHADQPAPEQPAPEQGRAVQITAPVSQMKAQRSVLRRGVGGATARPPMNVRGIVCDPVKVSLATGYDNLDIGSEITLQAGMVQDEGFAQTYIVPDPNPATPQNEAFPIRVDLIEFVIGTVATVSGGDGNPIRAGYTIDVYDGEPVNGNGPVFTASSTDDPANNPDLPEDPLLERVGGVSCQTCGTSNLSASVAKVQFSVESDDPSDKIQIFGADNVGGVATGRFTVVVRLTRMNNLTPVGDCSFGITNQCGPLSRCANAFLATESNNGGSLNYPTRNWGFFRSCGPFACAGGVYRFSQLSSGGGLSSGCRPSRDTLIQATYTPAICSVAAQGACCAGSGACTVQASAACTSGYQGNGTVCAPNPCPQPVSGGCCINGTCDVRSNNNCVSAGGVYQGDSTTCAGVTCGAPGGACCLVILGLEGCQVLSPSDCTDIAGTYQGNGAVCVPDPFLERCGHGACCLASGSCSANLTAASCTSQGGTYKGNGSTCTAGLCPTPTGACCYANGACLVGTAQCVNGLPGTVFMGAGTSCNPSPCPQPGICCVGATCFIGITQAGCAVPAPVGASFIQASFCNAAGNRTSPCCYANFNKTGGITVQDIFDYLAAWFALNPYAKMAGNGQDLPTAQDIFDFLAAWFTGGCS